VRATWARWPHAVHRVLVLKRDFVSHSADFNRTYGHRGNRITFTPEALAAHYEAEVKPGFIDLQREGFDVQWWDPTTDQRLPDEG
jgi:hypothetical protein